uniref:response regulator n=1 Tax=Pararhizobium sp. IMCC3301 TaxID=3067904 RepID=UPI002740EB87|nr:response regulator [Pararhizobium sp. IMCC3301]
MGFAKCCAFIVDDESLIAFQLDDIVKSLGVHAVTMSKSGSALETLRQAEGCFQFAIVDIRNAGKFGADLLQEISRQKLPVVLTTTDDEVETNLLGNSPLRQVVVRKPFDSEDIRRAVQRLSLEPGSKSGEDLTRSTALSQTPPVLDGVKHCGT